MSTAVILLYGDHITQFTHLWFTTRNVMFAMLNHQRVVCAGWVKAAKLSETLDVFHQCFSMSFHVYSLLDYGTYSVRPDLQVLEVKGFHGNRFAEA